MQGEAYINRAAQLQTQTKNDDLQIIYKVCQGRVLDYKRKFIEAASRLTKNIFFRATFEVNYSGTTSCPTRRQYTTARELQLSSKLFYSNG